MQDLQILELAEVLNSSYLVIVWIGNKVLRIKVYKLTQPSKFSIRVIKLYDNASFFSLLLLSRFSIFSILFMLNPNRSTFLGKPSIFLILQLTKLQVTYIGKYN